MTSCSWLVGYHLTGCDCFLGIDVFVKENWGVDNV